MEQLNFVYRGELVEGLITSNQPRDIGIIVCKINEVVDAYNSLSAEFDAFKMSQGVPVANNESEAVVQEVGSATETPSETIEPQQDVVAEVVPLKVKGGRGQTKDS